MEINKPAAAIIILIITSIIVFLFVMPKYQESHALEMSLAAKQAQYNGESVYYGKISEILKEIDSRKDALEKIDSSLPPNPELAPLLYFLQKKGAETGSIVKSVSFLKIPQASQDNTIKDVTFDVELIGNYQSLKNFLFTLEKSVRLFEVDTISFASIKSFQNSAQVSDQYEVYDFKLEIKTHTY